jgi:hypothetical protein
MALVHFKLEDIPAFSSKENAGGSKDFCVDCACEASKKYKLVPYLKDHLDKTLSESGQDAGAAMLCDVCGRLIATYYPEGFWQFTGPE